MILEAYRETAPDVVLIELCPFGRKKFTPELMPLLEAAHADRPTTLVACSLRDILVGSRRDQQGHDDRAGRLANEYFDALLVHADARFATLEETFHPTRPAPHPGPLHGLRPRRTDARAGAGARGPGPRVGRRRDGRGAVVPGGGRGPPAAARRPRPAHRGRDRPVPPRARVSTSSPARRRVRRGWRSSATCRTSRAEMAASAVSVSQVGYNTTMDILGCATPAVVVPYGEGREDEQAERARRLERLGAVRVIDPDRLSAQTRSPTPYATPWTGHRWPSRSTSTGAPAPRSC